MRHVHLLLAGGVLALCGSAQAWVAYNDCNSGGMPVGVFPPNNTTRYGSTGTGYAGALNDFATGETLGASVNMVYVNTANGGTGPTAEFSGGTDAATIFGGYIVNRGNAIGPNGNTALENTFDIQITGLTLGQRYDFATTVDRGSASYDLARWTLISLVGAESSTYASSDGAVKISETTTSIPSYNTTRGLVAYWKDIDPGADGMFTVTFRAEAPFDASTLPAGYPAGSSQTINKMYGPTAFMVATAVPEPGMLSLLGLAGLALGRRARRR